VNSTHNKTVETNRRPAFPFDAGRKFRRAAHAQPLLSAAVAHLFRWLHDQMETALTVSLLVPLLAIASCSAQERGQQALPLDIILQATDPQPGLTADEQPVVRALAQLAKTQGLNHEDFAAYRTTSSFAVFSGGAFSRKISTGQSQSILVVQTVAPMSIPGTSAQQLVLLNLQGKILDRFQCDINSRYGVIKAEIFPAAQEDGTQIIIRFHGGVVAGRTNWWHNWHTIVHDGFEKTFRDMNENEANEWDRMGLARIAISRDHFLVVYPKLKPEKDSQPDGSANGSQPFRSETNPASSAAGSQIGVSPHF